MKRTEEKTLGIDQAIALVQEKSQKRCEELAADAKGTAQRVSQAEGECKKLSSEQSSLRTSIQSGYAAAQERLDSYKKQMEDKWTSFGEKMQYNASQTSK